MKSVIAQGSTVAKAIEEALKKADMPKEFFVKLLEDAQPGFLGFGSKKAKIALFFKEENVSSKHSESMFSRGSYENLFNNPNMRKQIEQQLKELGLEIQPIAQKAPTVQKQHKESFDQGSKPRPQNHQQRQMQPRTVQQRPLSQDGQPQRRQQHQQQPSGQTRNVGQSGYQSQSVESSNDQSSDQPRSDNFRRRRRSRYHRPRNRNFGDDGGDNRGYTENDQNKSYSGDE